MSETFSMTDEEDGALSAMANNGAMNYSLNLPKNEKNWQKELSKRLHHLTRTR